METNSTDEFKSNMSNFMKILDSNDDLKKFIKNPTYSTEKQKIIFEKILTTMNFNKTIKNFFSILAIKKRIFFLDKIIEEFLNLVSTKRGEINGSLISSKKIDNKTLVEI